MSEFLGEAFVRIRPDTRGFGAELKTEIGGAAAAASIAAQSAIKSGPTSAARAGAEAGKAATATRALTQAQNANTAAAAKNAFVTRSVTTATSELAIAQIRASRASEAVIFAENALAKARGASAAAEAVLREARAGGVAATVALADADALAAKQAVADAEANLLKASSLQESTAATLRATKAEAAHSSQLAFARRGILASALSFAGLRGATLAANSAFIAGAAGLIAFAKSLSVFATFETQLNTLRVVTGATADEMERVSEVARQLGADVTLPGVSAGDAAEAMLELAKAGLSVQDAIAGARGVLQLATAANISNADATQLAASALNAFGLAGDQAVRVADVLANAANLAQGSIQDMGLSLQQAAAVGRQVGLSLEDTTVFLTALTRAGIRGSDAGTSLRTALLRLINPTKKIQAVFDELGLSLRDSTGNIRPDFFVNLGIALQGLSKDERDAKIATLGGADAIRSLSILSRQSIDDLIGLRKEIRQQGTASDVAAARTQGLAGAAQQLGNTLENIGLSIGQAVGPGLENFAHSLNTAIATIAASSATTTFFHNQIDLLGTAFGALGATLQTVGPPLLGLASAFQGAVNAIGLPTLLAGIAAYKLYPRVIALAEEATVRFAVALETQRSAVIASSVAIGGLRSTAVAGAAAGFTALRTAALSFAASATGVGIAVGVLAGGLLFLITRETDAERAMRHLKGASDDLAGSLAAQKTIVDQLASATSNITTEKLALDTAKLTAAQARQALENSTASKGSIERAQLENGLAVALDNVRLAEQRLLDTRKEAALLAEQKRQADINTQAARAKEADAINEVIEAERNLQSASRARAADIGGERGAAINAKLEASALENVITKLRERADVEAAENTEQSLFVAKRLRQIAQIAEETGKLPSEHAIEILVKADTLKEGLAKVAAEFGLSGKESIDNFLKSVREGITGKGADKIFKFWQTTMDQINGLFLPAGEKAGKDYSQGFVQGAKASQDRIANAAKDMVDAANSKLAAVDDKALSLRIKGAFTPQAQLQNLLDKKAAQEATFAGLKRQRTIGDATDEQVRQAKEDLADTVDAIKTLRESIKTDAESAAKEIQDAKDEADDAVIEAFTGGKKRTRLENLLIRAEGTEGLGDDIKFNKAMIKLLERQKKNAASAIKNLEKRRDFIRDTNKLILQITNQIKDDEQKQKDLLRQKREDRDTERGARIDADIEFAQIKENTRAEIAAHKAKIRFLKHQQHQLIEEKGQRAKNTAAYKELRNQIAAELKAIADLRGEKKGLDLESRKMIFEFLQTQQGFAANLLGNLFATDLNLTSPGGGSGPGGTGIGNKSTTSSGGGGLTIIQPGIDPKTGRPIRESGSPATKLGPEAAIADAKGKGPTSGQAHLQIHYLREIRDILLGNYKGNSKNHPAAHHQKVASGGSFDIM